MIKIFDNAPGDWKELQEMVGTVFRDLGYLVEIEKDIQTVRGKVSVDVYAESTGIIPKQTIICECKYWNSNVPKSIIHGFRTVINDSGANSGFLISKVGFQTGSFDAVQMSNVILFTWNEFIEAHRICWIEAMIKKVREVGQPVRKFVLPSSTFYDEPLKKLGKEKETAFFHLVRKYKGLAFSFGAQIYQISEIMDANEEYLTRIYENDKTSGNIPSHISSLNSYFKYLINWLDKGTEEFDKLFGQKVRK